MKIPFCFTALLAAAALTLSASAQAPAGAPAGSNGVCKDGTYSTAANKDGACRGHKGVQTWYAATSAKPTAGAVPAKTAAAAPAVPAAAPAVTPAPRPTPTQATAPAPAPRPAPTTAAAPTAPAARRAAPAQTAAAAGGGPGQVWVNSASKVYHCQGTAYYGKTKAGKYMTEDAAKAEGDRPNGGKPCTK